MGMNIAGGAQQVKQDAANLGISADEKVRAERGLAGFFSARDSNTRAEALGVRSRVTDLPDGMGMNIAGGAQQVKQDAADLGISADEKVRADCTTAESFGGRASAGCNMATAQAASALATRGVSNPNVGAKARNPDALQLDAEIGLAVMGPVQWEQYITTSAKQMTQGVKLFTAKETQKLAAKRPSGEREGWGFHHVVRTTPRWAMADKVTFTLLGHTEENPILYTESLREAISEAYHANWTRYSTARNKDQKDEDAGKQLSRSRKP